MKLNHTKIAALSLGLVALSAIGCGKIPGEGARPVLANVKAPAGFKFATSHGVEVDLSAAASALPASGRGELQIALASGKMIYRGQLNARHPLHMKFSVPLKDSALTATLEGPTGAMVPVSLPIANATAQYAFQ